MKRCLFRIVTVKWTKDDPIRTASVVKKVCRIDSRPPLKEN